MRFYAKNKKNFNDTECAAILTFNSTDFSFHTPVSNIHLSMQIDTINVDTITFDYYAWGRSAPIPDKIAVNNAMRALIPSINAKLAPHHVSYPGQGALSLEYYNDYLGLGILGV